MMADPIMAALTMGQASASDLATGSGTAVVVTMGAAITSMEGISAVVDFMAEAFTEEVADSMAAADMVAADTVNGKPRGGFSEHG